MLFDLLTALLDSWSLWNQAAGSPEAGLAWRTRYLRLTYGAGAYVPYEDLVLRAARAIGLPDDATAVLIERWDELAEWPEVAEVLGALEATHRLGVVTNCSRALADRAVRGVSGRFAVVVSAEEAGHYKPRPEPYGMALSRLGLPGERVLFVAGSAFDVEGASALGMPVFWHNRIGLELPAHAPAPRWMAPTLHPLMNLAGAQT